ncbi:carboxy-terminal processing protease [Acetobacter tropicalis NBRC 101654]|uniref:Carboxy-terminal processing protease n=1 Tax=Acetobacter tropicalis NBRC 101654 TaxID=749388 RepID=F7VHT2_9PROT|nr:carboxy-terminal processing protease [Acetobacter tropicalis NBRC 101654]
MLPCVLIATLLVCQPMPLKAQTGSPAGRPDTLPSAQPDAQKAQATSASASATANVAPEASSGPVTKTADTQPQPSASSAEGTTGTATAPEQTSAALPETAPPAPAAPPLDMALVHSVIATALEFLGPRTLEQHSSRDFTLWGLGSLTALDPTLAIDSRGADIRLLAGQTPLLTRATPAPQNDEGWAQLAVDFLAAAREHSDGVRTATREELVQAFFDELFNHLDPYSRYIGPSSASTDREARVGGEADAGVTLTRKGRDIVISAVNANGPAWSAEVDTGDKLLAVNNRLTAGQSVETVTNWLRGEEDSRVTLRLLSPGQRRGHTVVLRRAKVPPETVFAFASGSLVVLRVTSFSSDTAEEMSQYLDQATQDPGLKGLIIDLRGNRGGVLQQAVTAAALLLDRGVAAVTDGRDAQANHIWAVQGGDMTNGLPIAILVDGRTASAAEILAAALADHKRAVVIGSSTLGKGLVQTVAQLPDEGELFVTWSRVIAPLHWPLQGLGVMPQLCTSLGEADSARQMHDLAHGQLDNQPAVQASRAARFPLPVSRILAIRKACPAALGSDRDMTVARSVLENKAWYATALSAIPDDPAALPSPVRE